MTEAMDHDEQSDRLPFEDGPVDHLYGETDPVTADHVEGGGDDVDDNHALLDEGIEEHDATDWEGLTVSQRQGLIAERFGIYRDVAEFLLQQQLETDVVESIPGYVDSGTEVDVFRHPEHPGVVFKLPGEETRAEHLSDSTIRGMVDGRVHALLLPGHEQMVAYTNGPRMSAVVCKDVEGARIWDLRPEQRELISDEEFADLIRVAGMAQTRNVNWDMGTSKNFIRGPEGGLTTVDYKLGPSQTLVQKLLNFADVSVLLEGTEKGSAVPDYALRFRDVCGRMVGTEVAHMIEGRWRREQRTFDSH